MSSPHVMCYAIHGVLTALINNEYDDYVAKDALRYCVRCLEFLGFGLGESSE